ncbi:hypothetical protein SAMN04515674_11011 [Pseudarcicella hirudinis]|uniref:Uncharacterized protein n=1 Tax=Pseudarcicella hirudinis TaxID=1079859 RepID=A0A1I5VR28_9BACT|nr:hypothetical protein [Pseudarcicella hirudinis]SFQ09912.1 hypothetical protein SAMN04515674_11011 [Pseudarcicella hirudinis]
MNQRTHTPAPVQQESQHKLSDLFLSSLTWAIFISALITQFFLPWWTIALCSGISSFFLAKSGGEAFMKGLVSAFLLWLIFALYYHLSTNGILSQKIANILPVNGRTTVLIILSAFIGGLVAAWGSLSGYLLRKHFK